MKKDAKIENKAKTILKVSEDKFEANCVRHGQWLLILFKRAPLPNASSPMF
jgi:hypothetical protein